jgi:hypothetical protein
MLLVPDKEGSVTAPNRSSIVPFERQAPVEERVADSENATFSTSQRSHRGSLGTSH